MKKSEHSNEAKKFELDEKLIEMMGVDIGKARDCTTIAIMPHPLCAQCGTILTWRQRQDMFVVEITPCERCFRSGNPVNL